MTKNIDKAIMLAFVGAILGHLIWVAIIYFMNPSGSDFWVSLTNSPTAILEIYTDGGLGSPAILTYVFLLVGGAFAGYLVGL